MSWTDDRVEQLKSMWNEGKSASQIAKSLGGVTRNAVIGKVHRLGLSNRVTGAKEDGKAPAAETAAAPEPEVIEVEEPVEPAPEPRPALKDAPRRPAAPPTLVAPPAPPVVEENAEAIANLSEVERRAKRLHLMQLTERTCKWPIGDPATDDFWFCGLPAQAGKPYCDAHVAVAFQPMSSRRDRKSGSR